MELDTALSKMPLIAILRGIALDTAVDVCAVLIECGILAIETPLNTPQAVDSIERMAGKFGNDAAIGAGTVLEPEQVRSVCSAGATFTVSPNTNAEVIEAAIASGVTPVPGFATPSEAFLALQSGASHLKLFPADSFGPRYLKALNAVLPAQSRVFAVGGVTERNVADWIAAGAAGVGIGSALYKPGRELDAIKSRASGFVRRYKAVSP